MICIPILAGNTEEAVAKMQEAEPLADLFELRRDVMTSCRLKDVIALAPRPVIITYRSRQQGGEGADDYGAHSRILSEAMELGAGFVDVEHPMPAEYQQRLFRDRGKTRVIISCHVLHETPDRSRLEKLYFKLADRGPDIGKPDIVKIVTHANEPEDNLRVLDLIPLARDHGIPVITFCMGPLGRVSRVVSPLMGGFLTFASLARGEESASGQLTATEMRDLINILSP
jgi:3-dehydroquinate dehydratase type I